MTSSSFVTFNHGVANESDSVCFGFDLWNKSSIPESWWQAMGEKGEMNWKDWCSLCCDTDAAPLWAGRRNCSIFQPIYLLTLAHDGCEQRGAHTSSWNELPLEGGGIGALRIVPLSFLKALKRSLLRWFGFLVKMPQAAPWWGGPGIYQSRIAMRGMAHFYSWNAWMFSGPPCWLPSHPGNDLAEEKRTECSNGIQNAHAASLHWSRSSAHCFSLFKTTTVVEMHQCCSCPSNVEDLWSKKSVLAHIHSCKAMEKNAVVYKCSVGECPVNSIFCLLFIWEIVVLMRHDCGADSTINPSVQLGTVKHQQRASHLPPRLNRACFHVLLLSVYLSQRELPVVWI